MVKIILMNLLQIFYSKGIWGILSLWATMILAFFAPIGLMFGTFTFSVILDLITGMIASYKRGEKIESRKMCKTILKLLIYMLVAAVFYMFQMAIFPVIPLINIVFGLIILTELKSITENCDSIFKTKTWTTIYEKARSIFSGSEKRNLKRD